MSYAYTNGDGLAVLSVSTPDGASEPVSNLDDAIRQVKAYLKDDVAGVAKIQEVIDQISQPSTLIASMGSTQAITSGTGPSVVNFDTALVDPRSAFDAGTHQYTAPLDGLYQVIASVESLDVTPTAPLDIRQCILIYIQGIEAARVELAMDDYYRTVVVPISRLFQLSAGNTIDIRFEITCSGGSLVSSLQTDATKCIFQVSRLSD